MNFIVKKSEINDFTFKNLKLMNFTADQKSQINEFD